jgi:hypothetical protein
MIFWACGRCGFSLFLLNIKRQRKKGAGLKIKIMLRMIFTYRSQFFWAISSVG